MSGLVTALLLAILVHDINPNPPAGAPGLEPQQFAAAGGRAVFLAPEGKDYLLWATDGTVAGTSPLVRLCSPCEGVEAPAKAAELPGVAFYLAAGDEGSPRRLWRTDGTRAGTFPLSPPHLSGYSVPAMVLGRRLLFQECRETCDLWITDGSPAGTRLLHGALGAGWLAAARDGRAFFFGRDAQGDALWVTDGTPEGTKRLHAIHFADYLTVSGSRAFYLDRGGDYPDELWTSDGTARGTRFVRRFYQPGEHLPPNTSFLKAVAGGIVFVATLGRGDEVNIWRSDGTRDGTRRITAFPNPSLEPLTPDEIVPVGDRLLFVATDSVIGPRLWSTDGSPAGTAPLTGCPGGCPALRPYWPLLPTGHGILLTASDAAHGMELWTTDGTGAGTHLFRDLCPGPCDSNPEAFTPHGGIIDFRATWDGQPRLVRTDGAAAVPLAPVPPAPPYAFADLLPLDLADVGRRTFFAGLDSQGSQPWVTDGTPAGSRRLAGGASGGSDPRDFAVLGDRLFFTASDGATRSVWTVDASGAAAPVPGTGVATGLPGPSGLTVSGGLAYFVSDLGTDVMELWRTDGTPAGTLRLAAFPDKALSDLRDLNGRLVLLARSTTGDQPVFSLWTSDGTPAGTAQRLGLPPDTVEISAVTALGSELYFVLQSETASWIYRSDGTAAGTRTILQQGDFCEDPGEGGRFVRLGGIVYFPACTGDGLALHQTDGTAAGTAQVIPAVGLGPGGLFAFQDELYYFGYNPDPDSFVRLILWKGRTAAEATSLRAVGFQIGDPIAPEFTPLGDRLYFRAWDPAHGFELWRTDGTPAGTVLVRDLSPGRASGDPQGLVAAGGRLWFSALDPEHGRELWTSDGTRPGTRLAVDLAPGPPASAPEQLTPFNGRLYCAADDGVAGREPWSVALTPSPARD